MADYTTTVSGTGRDSLKRVLVAPLLVIAAPFVWLALILQRPTRLLLTYIWLLPVHVLVMTILFGLLGAPASVVRVIAAWKEISLLAVLSLLLIWTPTHRRSALRLTLPDICAMLLLVQAALYVVFPVGISESNLDLTGRLYGFRDSVFLTLIYFVGRLAPISARDARRIIKALALLGIVSGVVALIEWWVPTDAYVRLGLVRYYNDFLGIHFQVNPYVNPFGLPENFWATIGSLQVRRAGSLHISSQAFAVSYLLTLPAILYTLQTATSRRSRWRWSIGLAVCLVTLLMTITRMTIFVCLLQLVIIGLLSRRLRRRILVALAGMLVLVIASLPLTGRFFLNTINLDEPSTAGHIRAWTNSLQYFSQSPLVGHGLGTGGQTARRLDAEITGDESQYFKLTGEMGLPGLLLYLGLAGGVLVAAYRGWRRERDPDWRGMYLVVCVAGIGIGLNALVTGIYSVPFLTYVYWWLAGMAIQARAMAQRARETTSQREEVAHA